MLSSVVRTSCARSAARAASSRNFATAVDTAGLKVAALDNGQPTSAVTLLVKAGSRHEPKAGVAHALKNFAFKSTAQRSALRTVREAELYGGVLSTTLTREHLALTAEFLRGDEAYFVELLASLLTSTKFSPHEFNEAVLPAVHAETAEAGHNPATRAIELAHALAFRSGLGSSLFASPSASLSHEDVKSFAATAFNKGNVAVFGTGIDQAVLSKLVEKNLGSLASGASTASTGTRYYGGETRVAGEHGPQTVFIGFGTAGAPTAELRALASYLSPTPAVKWSKGTSPLANIAANTSVESVLLPYSDGTLFGLLVQGQTAAGVKESAKAAVAALKQAASGAKAEDLTKAVAKAKFSAANAVESRDGLIAAVAPTLLSESKASIDTIFASLDGVNAAGFSKAATALTQSKPTYVALGDIQALPYADELGL